MIAPPDASLVFAHPALSRLGLDQRSLALELGRDDDNLVDSFAARGVRVLRLEASDRFNEQTARRVRQEHGRADLIVIGELQSESVDRDAVLAGIPLLLAWNGTLTFQLPRDLSVEAAQRWLEPHALRAYDVAERTTHSGAVRIWACHAADVRRISKVLRERIAS